MQTEKANVEQNYSFLQNPMVWVLKNFSLEVSIPIFSVCLRKAYKAYHILLHNITYLITAYLFFYPYFFFFFFGFVFCSFCFENGLLM
jgi:hypothetical protein